MGAMLNINFNFKAIFTFCAALTMPTVLPAATYFTSVSPVETKSSINLTETLTSVEEEDTDLNSDKLCVDNNLGRTRLKELLQDNRKVVLTFDDGPHPNTTPHILEILKKRNLKAAFFVLGLQAKKYPELVKKIHEDGHIIGNHSYGHKNLVKISAAEREKEIKSTNSLIEKITGKKPKYLRPPFGALNKAVREAINEAGMSIVLWTVDTRDWKTKNEFSILKEVDRQLALSQGKCIGGAILMHDIYPATVRALDKMLDKLATHEYKIASIDQLGNTESEFWSVKAPVIFKNAIGPVKADPEVSGNPLMISLIKEKTKNKVISHIALLRARKEGNLLVYLAKNSMDNQP